MICGDQGGGRDGGVLVHYGGFDESLDRLNSGGLDGVNFEGGGNLEVTRRTSMTLVNARIALALRLVSKLRSGVLLGDARTFVYNV